MISENKKVTRSQMVKRCIMLLLGIFLMGTGMVLIIKTKTGSSPMSSVTNIMTQVYPALSLGAYTFLLNTIFFVGEFIVIPKNFSLSKFLQLIPTFFLSIAVDANMFLLWNVMPNAYVMKIAVLIIGCMIFGFSIALMVAADVILMPGDAFVKVISVKYNMEYGNVKMAVDIIMVLLAAVVSLTFLKTIYGVGEGTLIAALTIGNFMKVFKKFTCKLVS